MKPFLLIQIRPEDSATKSEYISFLSGTGLSSSELLQHRADKYSLVGINLNDYTGIFIGGSPFNISDDEKYKSEVQKRVELELINLVRQAYKADYPIFGVCYGLGVGVTALGGLMSAKYSEYMDVVDINLIQGTNDSIIESLPGKFKSVVGHNEACELLPKEVTVLASSNWCPHQLIKAKNNLYFTQFHPEVDYGALKVKVETYASHGYFDPNDAEQIIKNGNNIDNQANSQLLRNFVERLV